MPLKDNRDLKSYDTPIKVERIDNKIPILDINENKINLL